ncbi:hypothetical protein [Devosia sp.]|uniref:hypothetical protein n=1 Tax=Devosia sp. TaxID=1871048 RepID=UPI002F04FE5A
MRVLLHIGQSKTGTSAIQAFLTLNRVRLERAGIAYPPARVGGVAIDLGSHNAVADAVAGRHSYPYLGAEAYAEQFFGAGRQRAANRMILSGEHFFGGHPRVWDIAGEDEYFALYREKVERVAAFLAGHDTEILVYLRPQVDWLESSAGHTIRIQGTLPRRDAYQDDRQFFALMRPLLRYGRLLDIWQEAMPGARITAVPYVRSQLVAGDSIRDFLHRAGIDAAALGLGATGLRVNESLARDYVEVKKALNHGRHGAARERAIIACLQRLSAGSRFGTGYTLPPDLVDEVAALAAPENAIVNARYACAGAALAAIGEDRREAPAPSVEDVQAAMAAFTAEFARPRYRLLELDSAGRAWLRRHARPLHGRLHQLKRLVRTARYRRA